MELKGKTALVTGGAVRLGRAIVAALAGEGMRVVVHYHSSSAQADQLCEEIRARGGEARPLGADLGDAAAAERLAAEAVQAFGSLDVLVNSASIFPPEKLEETDAALWDRTLAVNLRAPFLLTRALAAELRARRGAVVNLCDLAGLQAWSGYTAHSVSKAGLIHLTKLSARALAPEVRVNGIAPGAVLPPEDFSDEALERIARAIPLKRLGSADAVVHAVLYLLRADFVTGEVLVVDGGRMVAS